MCLLPLQVVLSLEPKRHAAYERRVRERKLVTVELLPVPTDPGHMLSSGLSMTSTKSMRLSAHAHKILVCHPVHTSLNYSETPPNLTPVSSFALAVEHLDKPSAQFSSKTMMNFRLEINIWK